MDPALQRPRFYQLIEEAIAEYEILQAAVGKLNGPGDCSPQGIGAQPESCRAGDVAEEQTRLNSGALEGNGSRFSISFAEQPQQPESFAHKDWEEDSADGAEWDTPNEQVVLLGRGAADVGASDAPWWGSEGGGGEAATTSSSAVKWWDLMIKVLRTQTMFVMRACWNPNISKGGTKGMGSISSLDLSPENPVTSSQGLAASLATTESDLDILRIVYMERNKYSRRFVRVTTQQGAQFAEVAISSVMKCMLDPHSSKRLVWVCLGLMFLVLDVFVMTMGVFRLQFPVWLDVVGVIFWTCDIFANFRTGVNTNHGVNMDAKYVARQYLKCWFWIDGCIVAYQWFTLMVDANVGSSGAKAVRLLKVARTVKLLRLAKFELMISHVFQRMPSLWLQLFCKMILCLLGVIVWVHVSATAWYAIGTMNENGWANQVEEFQTAPSNYLISIHWAASQLQGNVDVYPVVPIERAFASSQLLSSVVVLALLVSKLTTVMHEMQEVHAKRKRLLQASEVYLQENNISPRLAFSVKNFISRKEQMDAKHSHSRDEVELFRVIPAELRRALLEESRGPILLQHVLFTAFHRVSRRFFQRLCCDLLRSKNMESEERIFSVGEMCFHMYFVVGGSALFFTYRNVMSALTCIGINTVGGSRPSHRSHGSASSAGQLESDSGHVDQRQMLSNHIYEGVYLCEPVIWARWVHRGDLDAQDQAVLLMLEASALEYLVSCYATVRVRLRIHAVRVLEELNKHEPESLNDLFSTRDILRANFGVAGSSFDKIGGRRSV